MRFPALRSRPFLLYTGGNFFAMNGLWINRVIIGWLGWELTGLASWVGLLSFLLFAPTIISSPLFGVVLDRVDLRRAVIISQSIMAVTVLILLGLNVAGQLTIWSLCVITLTIGITTSADRSIRMTLVPRVVEKEALANAVAIHGINFNTARLIGPAVGGLLIDAFGSSATIALNFVLILPFLTILFFLKLRDRDPRQGERQHFFAELWDGARYAANHPIIREAMVLTGLFSLAVRGVLEILPAIADGVFARGAQGLGQMLAAAGAGAVISAIVIALTRSRSSEAAVPTSAYFTIAGGLIAAIALGLVNDWHAAVGVVFVIGYCATVNGVGMQATMQLAVDDAYRGRVMSLWIVIVIGGAAMSAIGLGALADLFGISAALISAGVAGLLCFGGANRVLKRPT